LRLFRLLQDAPGVTLHCPARVASFSRSEDAVSVTLENGTVLTASFWSRRMVRALRWAPSAAWSGAAALWAGGGHCERLYGSRHNGRAFERFTQHGPLAMLPMSDGRCSLVWCHPQDKAEEVLAWSDERFCTELQKPLAGGWGALPMRENGRFIRCR
jgi:2-octaprenyl-6-methoxyphenol hydroxylase